jgi:hypothetical protein
VPAPYYEAAGEDDHLLGLRRFLVGVVVIDAASEQAAWRPV